MECVGWIWDGKEWPSFFFYSPQRFYHVQSNERTDSPFHVATRENRGRREKRTHSRVVLPTSLTLFNFLSLHFFTKDVQDRVPDDGTRREGRRLWRRRRRRRWRGRGRGRGRDLSWTEKKKRFFSHLLFSFLLSLSLSLSRIIYTLYPLALYSRGRKRGRPAGR